MKLEIPVEDIDFYLLKRVEALTIENEKLWKVVRAARNLRSHWAKHCKSLNWDLDGNPLSRKMNEFST